MCTQPVKERESDRTSNGELERAQMRELRWWAGSFQAPGCFSGLSSTLWGIVWNAQADGWHIPHESSMPGRCPLHYTQTHTSRRATCFCLCVCVCAGQWRVIGRPWPISVAWLKKVKKNGRHWGRAVVNSVPHQCISVSSTPFWWLTITSGLCAHSHVHTPMARYVCTYPYTYTARKWRSTLLKQKSITHMGAISGHTHRVS